MRRHGRVREIHVAVLFASVVASASHIAAYPWMGAAAEAPQRGWREMAGMAGVGREGMLRLRGGGGLKRGGAINFDTLEPVDTGSVDDSEILASLLSRLLSPSSRRGEVGHTRRSKPTLHTHGLSGTAYR